VSGKLIQQFATNLEAMINADSAAGQGTAAPEAAADAGTDEAGAKTAADAAGAGAGAGVVQEPAGSAQAAPAAARPAAPVVKQEESLNAFKFVVVPILKRLIPVAAAGAAIAVVFLRAASAASLGPDPRFGPARPPSGIRPGGNPAPMR
jgi:hypothetical protein